MGWLYNTTVQPYSSVKKVFLKISQNSQENICVAVSFLIELLALTKKATPTHVSACEFCEIFEIIFLRTTFPVATSERAWSMERAVTKIISYILIKYPTSYCEQSYPASEKKTPNCRGKKFLLQNPRKVGFKSPSRCQNSFN